MAASTSISMTPPTLLFALFLLLITISITTVSSFQTHNITKLLAQHPSLSSFNTYLSKTHLADEINSRQTITVLALDNSAMSSLTSNSSSNTFSLYTIRNILSLHILVDYFGTKKLHQLTNGTTLTASLFQSSGEALGNSGYVNITDLHGGKVGFSPADDETHHDGAVFVKSVVEMPYKISVIQISQMLDSAQAEAPTPEPSQTDLISLLGDKGCKAFAHLLTTSGAAKTFQDNIDSGLTVFCVGDKAVNSFMPKYKNLTNFNKTSFLLYHGIPVYNSMSMFKSNNGAVNTLATDGDNKYDITIQNHGETVTLKTKIGSSTITGTLVDDQPLACYKLDKFLLPRELFKLNDIKQSPAPTPEAESPSDDVDEDDDEVADQTTRHSKKNAAPGKFSTCGGLVTMVIAIFGYAFIGLL